MKYENGQLFIKKDDKDIIIEVESSHLTRYVHAWLVPKNYRENEIFISFSYTIKAFEIPACASDQYAYIGHAEIPASEAAFLEIKKMSKLQDINNACDKAVHEISAGYPETEILSWSVQVKEAEMYLLDQKASTPLLSALANQRNVALDLLANLVILKANAFSAASGAIIGKRQMLERKIIDAKTLTELELITW